MQGTFMKIKKMKRSQSKKNLRLECDNFLGNFLIGKPFVSDLQKQNIFERYGTFVSDPSAKAVALFQKPFENIQDLDLVERVFGEKARFHAETLNRINNEDKKILKNHEQHEKMLLLYLVNLESCYIDFGEKYFKKNNFKKRIPYAQKIIKILSARELTGKLDDIFFSVMHPKSFAYYSTLFKSSWDVHRLMEKRAKEKLRRNLEEVQIEAEIQSRTKSISSLHEKVVKKNILPSQVVDIIGLRILVNSKKDCYRVLEVMLSQWPTQYNRVKDYVAIPKENGYQSIHISGDYNGYQLEIQIRTFNMHYQAQYGKAAHHLYKANK
ncbi:MAG: GTP diphosphokinase [uncultured bacterium]|nr:MAG: GTP diphosphokinase [uncultured bacterium]